jgi:hypothetical protein
VYGSQKNLDSRTRNELGARRSDDGSNITAPHRSPLLHKLGYAYRMVRFSAGVHVTDAGLSECALINSNEHPSCMSNICFTWNLGPVGAIVFGVELVYLAQPSRWKPSVLRSQEVRQNTKDSDGAEDDRRVVEGG